MYNSYVEVEYIATSFSPARTDLALKLLIVLTRLFSVDISHLERYPTNVLLARLTKVRR
jgi:hypothetical protein